MEQPVRPHPLTARNRCLSGRVGTARARCCTGHAGAAYGEMTYVGAEAVPSLEFASERLEQARGNLDNATAVAADEVLVRTPAGQVPLGRPVAQVHVIGDVQLFEAFERAVNRALADVGVLCGDHRDDLFDAAVPFGLYEGGDDRAQGNRRSPAGLPDRRTAASTAGSPGGTGCGPCPLTEVIG